MLPYLPVYYPTCIGMILVLSTTTCSSGGTNLFPAATDRWLSVAQLGLRKWSVVIWGYIPNIYSDQTGTTFHLRISPQLSPSAPRQKSPQIVLPPLPGCLHQRPYPISTCTYNILPSSLLIIQACIRNCRDFILPIRLPSIIRGQFDVLRSLSLIRPNFKIYI